MSRKPMCRRAGARTWMLWDAEGFMRERPVYTVPAGRRAGPRFAADGTAGIIAVRAGRGVTQPRPRTRTMPVSRPHDTLRDVVCPLCSLLCDDLTLQVAGDSIRVDGPACPRAAAGFGRRPETGPPLIDGKPASIEQAARRAAALLREARQPLFAGLATDVNGCRAALDLAGACGAILDHLHGEAAWRNLRVLQSGGWIMT